MKPNAAIFSIGLNTGTGAAQREKPEQLHATLRALCAFGTVRDLAIGRATWEGAPERFVQALLEFPSPHSCRYTAAAIFARELSQSCVAVRLPDARADAWRLVDADGQISVGCGTAENPVILEGAGRNPYAPRVQSGRDSIGHSSIQPWSAGALFPAVIARIERDAGAVVSYELTIGAFREEYATREDAESVARWTCANGKVIPERYAQLKPGAGRSMAAFGQAMAPDVNPADVLHVDHFALQYANGVRADD